MFSLIGLIEYCAILIDDIEANNIKENAINGLINSLSFYDTGYGTYYDRLFFKVVTNHYKYIHVLELQQLHTLTNILTFDDFAKRWTIYQ